MGRGGRDGLASPGSERGAASAFLPAGGLHGASASILYAEKAAAGQEHGAGRTGRTALKEEKPAQSMKCVIVRDLLQNCAEGMVSDGTAEDIRNHLQECCCCRAFLENLEKGESAETAD